MAITGCSPRITSAAPPSRYMTKRNVGTRRDAATDRHAVGGHAARGDATANSSDSCDQPPFQDPPGCVGETHGPGGGGVSARVPDVWLRHPADLVHHGAGPDPEGPHPLGRTTRTAADFSRSRAARRLGRTRPGSGSWTQYAPAGLVFTFTEDGTDTTVNWSGTLNTGGLTVEVTLDTQAGTGVLGNTTTIALMDSSPKLRFNQPFAEVDPNSWTVFGLQ
jgi:hypothetical protein